MIIAIFNNTSPCRASQEDLDCGQEDPPVRVAADRRAERGGQLRGAGGRRGFVEMAGVQLRFRLIFVGYTFLILKMFGAIRYEAYLLCRRIDKNLLNAKNCFYS